MGYILRYIFFVIYFSVCRIVFLNELLILKLNQATNKLDLSQLYGSNEELGRTLRTFSNGELRHSMTAEEPCLPFTSEDEHWCMHNSTTDNVCYKSGNAKH